MGQEKRNGWLGNTTAIGKQKKKGYNEAAWKREREIHRAEANKIQGALLYLIITQVVTIKETHWGLL